MTFSAPRNRLYIALFIFLALTAAISHTSADPVASPPDTATGNASPAWPDVRTMVAQAESLDDIQALIVELGHKEFANRSAAEKKLIEIGLQAEAFLRKAAADDDPEVAFRAKRALAALAARTSAADQHKFARRDARADFSAGRYAEASARWINIIRSGPPAMVDIIELGHVCQMAERWEDAAICYGLAAAKARHVQAALLAGAKPAEAQPLAYAVLPWRLENGRWTSEIEPAPAAAAAVDGNRGKDVDKVVRQNLALDRTWTHESIARLMLLLGRLQRDKLGDAGAAADSFAAGACPLSDFIKSSDAAREAPGALTLQMTCLAELAALQEQTGDIQAALKSWSDMYESAIAGTKSKHYFDVARFVKMYDLDVIQRLAQALPAGSELPPGILLKMISADHPEATLDLQEPQQDFWASKITPQILGQPPTSDARGGILVAPAGQEFETIEIICDANLPGRAGLGGNPILSCQAAVRGIFNYESTVGELRPEAGATGEITLRGKFATPRGVSRLTVACFDNIAVRVQLRAGLRPARRQSTDACLVAQGYPEGGKLTIDGREFDKGPVAQATVPAGIHRLQYQMPDGSASMTADLNLAAGRSYAFAAIQGSPFAIKLTNLPSAGAHVEGSFHSSSLVRLGDGRWLAAWGNNCGDIMLSASRDLVTWDEPWPFALNSSAEDSCPTLADDGRGGAWIGWNSNRFAVKPDHDGFQPMVAHTADGKSWTKTRLLTTNAGNFPSMHRPAPLRLMRTKDGTYLATWFNSYTTGPSPDALRPLAALPFMTNILSNNRQHFACDDNGRWHCVTSRNSYNQKQIFYATGDSPEACKTPEAVFAAASWKIAPADPRIIVGKDRMAVIYDKDGDLWMRTAALAEQPKFNDPVRITGAGMKADGASFTVTPEGKVVMLCGADGIWLLEADLDDLLAAAPPQVATAPPAPPANATAAARWKVLPHGAGSRQPILTFDDQAIWFHGGGLLSRYDQATRQWRHYTLGEDVPCTSFYNFAARDGQFLADHNGILYLCDRQGRWQSLPKLGAGYIPSYHFDTDGSPLALVIFMAGTRKAELRRFSLKTGQWTTVGPMPDMATAFTVHTSAEAEKDGFLVTVNYTQTERQNRLFFVPRKTGADPVDLGKWSGYSLNCPRIGERIFSGLQELTFKGPVKIPLPPPPPEKPQKTKASAVLLFDLKTRRAVPISAFRDGRMIKCFGGEFGNWTISAYASPNPPLVRDINGDLWLHDSVMRDGEAIELFAQPADAVKGLSARTLPGSFYYDPAENRLRRPVPNQYAIYSHWNGATNRAWVAADAADTEYQYVDFSTDPPTVLRRVKRDPKWPAPLFEDARGGLWFYHGKTAIRVDANDAVTSMKLPAGYRFTAANIWLGHTGAVWAQASKKEKAENGTSITMMQFLKFDESANQFVAAQKPYDELAARVGRHELAVFASTSQPYNTLPLKRRTSGGIWQNFTRPLANSTFTPTIEQLRGDRLMLRSISGIWEYNGSADLWVQLIANNSFTAFFDHQGRRILVGDTCTLIYEGDPFDDPNMAEALPLAQQAHQLMKALSNADPLAASIIVQHLAKLPCQAAPIIASYHCDHKLPTAALISAVRNNGTVKDLFSASRRPPPQFKPLE